MNDHPPASPLLRSLLQAAREDAPSPEDLAEIARGLPLRSDAPRTAPRRLRPRLAAPAVAVSILALAAAVALWRRAAPRPVEPAVVADWPSAVPTAPESPPVAPVTSEPVAVPAPPTPPTALPPRPAAAARSVLRRPASPAPSAAAEPAGAPASASAPPGAATPGAAAARSEGDLLDRASIVLERNPTEALRLADEHLAAYPTGELREEREVIAVVALWELGRVDEARARGARFLQQYPRSARRSLIEGMLAPQALQ